MSYTVIPTRTSTDVAIPYEDTNDLMANTQYFKDAITVDSGDVGIGITPQALLHIHGSSDHGMLLVTNTFTGGASIDDGTLLYVANGTDDFAIQNSENGGEIQFYTNNGSITLSATIDADGDAWFVGDVSALTFTDRTPFYEGDAIEEIKKISGIDGKIDHDSLPEFVKVKKIRTKSIKDEDGEIEEIEIEEDGRDLGASISVLTVAIQQIALRLEELENNKNK